MFKTTCFPSVYRCFIIVRFQMLYSTNVIAQFCLLNQILGSRDFTYGFTLLRDIVNEIEWEKTGNCLIKL